MTIQIQDRRDRRAFSLVELLVVISIIGILLALLLPAIQAGREASRRSSCSSHLRQLSISLLTFHETYEKFPHGGWGRAWVGIAQRGVSIDQPGGWCYQLLPFIEEQSLHSLAIDPNAAGAEESYNRLLATGLPVFNCPTRRSSGAWPIPMTMPSSVRRPLGNAQLLGRGDYAINAGASHAFRFSGPLSLVQGDEPTFWSNVTDNRDFSGVSHLRKSVGIQRITDGTSHTYLVCEKFLPADSYETGTPVGDDDSLYSGYDYDNHRFTGHRPIGPAGSDSASTVIYAPFSDFVQTHQLGDQVRFGGPHSAGFLAAKCDGSVSLIHFDIDDHVHYRLGHRADGEPAR